MLFSGPQVKAAPSLRGSPSGDRIASVPPFHLSRLLSEISTAHQPYEEGRTKKEESVMTPCAWIGPVGGW